LAAPKATAKKPMTCWTTVSAVPSMSMAPTTTTPWMKLEPDISGVCRMTGTLAMIS